MPLDTFDETLMRLEVAAAEEEEEVLAEREEYDNNNNHQAPLVMMLPMLMIPGIDEGNSTGNFTGNSTGPPPPPPPPPPPLKPKPKPKPPPGSSSGGGDGSGSGGAGGNDGAAAMTEALVSEFKLYAAEATEYQHFGHCVAAYGSHVAVGASRESSASSVFLFNVQVSSTKFDGQDDQWSDEADGEEEEQEEEEVENEPAAEEEKEEEEAVDTQVHKETLGLAGVASPQSSSSSSSSSPNASSSSLQQQQNGGRVFERSGAVNVSWSQDPILVSTSTSTSTSSGTAAGGAGGGASDAYDGFGLALAMGNDLLAVGAPFDGRAGYATGLVYVFHTADSSSFSSSSDSNSQGGADEDEDEEGPGGEEDEDEEVAEASLSITANTTVAPQSQTATENMQFGSSLALFNNSVLVVGAPGAYVDNVPAAGAVFVFQYNATTR